MFTIDVQRLYRYIENGSVVSAKDEQRSCGVRLETANCLIHGSGEKRASAVVSRHGVDGADVAMKRAHTLGRVERPRFRSAVSRPGHDPVAVSAAVLLSPHAASQTSVVSRRRNADHVCTGCKLVKYMA